MAAGASEQTCHRDAAADRTRSSISAVAPASFLLCELERVPFHWVQAALAALPSTSAREAHAGRVASALRWPAALPVHAGPAHAGTTMLETVSPATKAVSAY